MITHISLDDWAHAQLQFQALDSSKAVHHITICYVEDENICVKDRKHKAIMPSTLIVTMNQQLTYRTVPKTLHVFINFSVNTTYDGRPLLMIIPQAPLQWLANLQQIHELLRTKRSEDYYKASMLVRALIFDWYTHEPPQNSIEAVKTYIHKNYQQPLTRAMIAETVNYSPSYLNQKFKTEVGFSLIDYVIHIRLQHAKPLLLNNQFTFQEVAEQVGYEDITYFSRIFKKHIGMTPGHYKRLYETNRPMKKVICSNDKDKIQPYNENRYHYEGGLTPMNFNWNQSVLVAFVLSVSLLLVACQSNEQETDQLEQWSYQSEFGEVTYPANPDRIVTDVYLGYFLELGVTPVGSNEAQLNNPYIPNEQKEGIEIIGESVEKILTLQPDVIVTADKEKYKQYEKVAPTIYLEYVEDIEYLTTEIGRILNKEQEAQQALIAYQANIEKAKQRIAKVIPETETFTVIDVIDGKELVTVYGDGFTGYPIYTGLGLKMPEYVSQHTDREQPWIQISNETIQDFIGDRVIVARAASTPPIDYKHAPVWRTIPAVQANKLYEIDNFKFWFTDPISMIGQIEDLADILIEREASSESL